MVWRGIREYVRSARAAVGDPEGRGRIHTWATRLCKQQKFSESIEAYNQLLKLNPDNVQDQVQPGLCPGSVEETGGTATAESANQDQITAR
jgi:hypothetical protein